MPIKNIYMLFHDFIPQFPAYKAVNKTDQF